MKEFELINDCLKIFPDRFIKSKELGVGPGDDCSVIPTSKDLIISTDSSVETIHFNLNWSSIKEVSWKVLAANDSDISACGGETLGYLISVGVPIGYSEIVKELYCGFLEYLEFKEKNYGLTSKILGGDTVSSPNFFINVTVLGRVNLDKAKNPVLRSGAKEQDLVCISKELGFSKLGLSILEGKDLSKFNFTEEEKYSALKIHKTPDAEIKLGSYLGSIKEVTSMIDISDGLLSELSHISKMSSVSLEINLDYFNSYLKGYPVFDKITSGEEYGLLFTIANEESLLKIKNDFPLVTKIGLVTEKQEENLYLIDHGQKISLSEYLVKNNADMSMVGYQHIG